MVDCEITANIDGRQLYGRLTGNGDPTVVLDAGMGDTSEVWAKVQPEVARFTRVFSYDRAGMGRSDKAPVPRTCKEIIADLRSLLLAAHLAPPYVLVAHSWSGINTRWYAGQYPDEIAGMVLIDAVHEDKFAHFEKVISEERANRMWASIKDPAKNDETIDRMASIAQVRSISHAFVFPLIVLTRNTVSEGTMDTPDELDIIETSLQQEFLKFSANSKQYITPHNDHFIQNSDPYLVIDVIRQIVETVRNG